MKKVYVVPEVDIIEFDNVDIITSSDGFSTQVPM